MNVSNPHRDFICDCVGILPDSIAIVYVEISAGLYDAEYQLGIVTQPTHCLPAHADQYHHQTQTEPPAQLLLTRLPFTYSSIYWLLPLPTVLVGLDVILVSQLNRACSSGQNCARYVVFCSGVIHFIANAAVSNHF